MIPLTRICIIIFSIFLCSSVSALSLPEVPVSRIEEFSQSNQTQYILTLSSNSIETIVSDTSALQLILKTKSGKISKNVKNATILVRFNCKTVDSAENWNSNHTDCSVMELQTGYRYQFDVVDETNSNDIDKILTQNLSIRSLNPGKQQLVAHVRLDGEEDKIDDPNIDATKAYITVNVGRSKTILTVSAVIGWIYFFAWSISFYPQVYDNFVRRSVVGLNFDFLALNLTGFLSYSTFNVVLFFVPSVQHQYEVANPHSQIPVEVNDVVFALHAVFATLIVIVQCLFYERSGQRMSRPISGLVAVIWIAYAILAVIVATTSWINMLTYLYIFSYVKLGITIIKYIPQAWFNYQRKSTEGWSIGNIFLDFTGGTLSMFQMFLLAYNYDDWITIFNNFTKFGLGFISILFDILFILQHYVFFPKSCQHPVNGLLPENDESDTYSKSSSTANLYPVSGPNEKKEKMDVNLNFGPFVADPHPAVVTVPAEHNEQKSKF